MTMKEIIWKYAKSALLGAWIALMGTAAIGGAGLVVWGTKKLVNNYKDVYKMSKD